VAGRIEDYAIVGDMQEETVSQVMKPKTARR